MERGKITRRELAALLAMAATAAAGKAAAQSPLEGDPALIYPLPEGVTARIWPGSAVEFSSMDDWDEFFVENSTPGGFHEKAWSEQVEPTFIEAGADLTGPELDPDLLMRSYIYGGQNQHDRTILKATGGEVLQAYQRLLEASKVGLGAREQALEDFELRLQSSNGGEERQTFYQNALPLMR